MCFSLETPNVETKNIKIVLKLSLVLMIKCQRFYFVTESRSHKITKNKTKNNLLKEFSSYLDILMQKQIILLCFHDGVTTIIIRVMTKGRSTCFL